MTKKIKLDRDRKSRIRQHVKENPRDSFADVARHFQTKVREIEDALRPPGPPPSNYVCEELFCGKEAHWGFLNGFFCNEHKGQGQWRNTITASTSSTDSCEKDTPTNDA